MRKIFKYAIMNSAEGIQVPVCGEVRAFQFQNGFPTLWIEVNPANEKITRYFKIFGTGHEIYEEARYIGTVQEGAFVWHAYEVFK